MLDVLDQEQAYWNVYLISKIIELCVVTSTQFGGVVW
jgi:hypothetical protein